MTFSSVKINIGTNPNDGTGDNLRDAFFKINYNFGQIEESLDGISKAVSPEGKSGQNGTSGIDGTSGTSGIDGQNGTSGVDGGKSIKKTKLLNHVIAVTPISGTTGEAVTSWSASYTSSGGSVEVIAQISGRRENAESIVNYYLQRDGVTVDTGTFCFNQVGVHTVLPTLCYITSVETGTHTYSIKLGTGLIVDQNDYCLMVVTEY